MARRRWLAAVAASSRSRDGERTTKGRRRPPPKDARRITSSDPCASIGTAPLVMLVLSKTSESCVYKRLSREQLLASVCLQGAQPNAWAHYAKQDMGAEKSRRVKVAALKNEQSLSRCGFP
ncbi:hypothetical protein EJB05_52002 [Eragrostis curvula]|uniref:Uncharacterized protein n=1 Tax=Eragrostis curvula TaxID=38414 RepID=A0A5J9STY3_9POAL|nr:hypothetical protein EJB05_52002 [Eragrostis curvula]